jgi:hypothetical protein
MKAYFNETEAAKRVKSLKLTAWNYIYFLLLLKYQQIKAIRPKHSFDRRSAPPSGLRAQTVQNTGWLELAYANVTVKKRQTQALQWSLGVPQRECETCLSL